MPVCSSFLGFRLGFRLACERNLVLNFLVIASMANLGEYDEPSPCPKAYCRRLTAEEHEAVVSSETEKHLNLLLTHLEENPKEFSELLKKRKIKEMEAGGVLSNIKVKVLTALYGKDFVKDVDQQTCKEKLKEFEALSVKVYNYSQGR